MLLKYPIFYWLKVMIDQILTTQAVSQYSRNLQTWPAESPAGSDWLNLSQSPVLLLIVYGFHFCSVLGCFKMQLTAVMMWKRGGKSIIYKVPQLHKCCGGSRHCNAQTLMKPCADLEIMKVAMTDLVEIIKIILFINWTWTVTAKLHQTATKILFGFY